MNEPLYMIIMITVITSTLPMQSEQPKPQKDKKIELPQYEQQYCCACDEDIPDQHAHFQYDPEHLVCTHCYYYRVSPSAKEDLEYISKHA